VESDGLNTDPVYWRIVGVLRSKLILSTVLSCLVMPQLLVIIYLAGGALLSMPGDARRPKRRGATAWALLYTDVSAFVSVVSCFGTAGILIAFADVSLSWLAAVAPVCVVLQIAYSTTSVRYDRWLKRTIADSPPDRLLVQPEQALEDIRERLPPELRQVLVPRRPRRPEDVVLLAAANLDWYLTRSPVIVRLGWLGLALHYLAVITAVVLIVVPTPDAAPFYMLLIACPAAVLWIWEVRRRILSVNRLWQYLERRKELVEEAAAE